jgi:hypothetical protein
MSLLISGDLRLANTYTLPDDADAVAYIAAVEAADGQALETATRMAINSFVKGCKADGIWPAIKASCILAGARTLAGALVPLVGTGPTNVGPFVSGDYDRKTGLGNPSNTTKYLNSNFLTSSLSATNHALLAYGTITGNTGDSALLGRFNGTTGASLIVLDEWAGYVNGRSFRSCTFDVGQFPVSTATTTATCIIGSRTSSTSATLFLDGVSITTTTGSLSLSTAAQPIYVFAINSNNVAEAFSRSKIQVYAIFDTGLTSTQAANLRAGITTLISAINVAF